MKKLLAFLLLVSVLVCNFLSCSKGENVETDGASSKDNAVTLHNTEGPTENLTEKPTERENEENDNTVFQILREYDTQIDADAFVEQLIAKEGNTAAELENYMYYSELEFVWAKLISLNKKAMLTVEVFANDEDAKLYYEENMSESVMPIFDDSFISFVRIGKVCMTFQQSNGKNITLEFKEMLQDLGLPTVDAKEVVSETSCEIASTDKTPEQIALELEELGYLVYFSEDDGMYTMVDAEGRECMSLFIMSMDEIESTPDATPEEVYDEMSESLEIFGTVRAILSYSDESGYAMLFLCNTNVADEVWEKVK